MTGLTADYLPTGRVPPSDVLPLAADAEQAVAGMADDQQRNVLTGRLDQIRRGAFDTIVIRDSQRPVCLIAVQPAGEDATLRFGHMLPVSEREREAILAISVRTLIDQGFRSISSVFRWPEQDAFTRAADAIGFTRVDRMDMVRKCEANNDRHPLPAGVLVSPWSPRCRGAAAGLLFENVYPGDRVFHKPYRTRDGCLAYLDSILDHRYGQFSPELSYVAHHTGRPVGMLLSADLPPAGLNVAELVVDKAFRGQGIATALIGRFIADGAAAQKGEVVLTVTESNQAAFRLYQRLGFCVTRKVGYYFYDTDA